MRIWDCDPTHLARKHLGGEWLELHQMLRALVKLEQGERAGWQSHPETLRFAERPWLLLGRRHWLQITAEARGYSYGVVPDVPDEWWTSFRAIDVGLTASSWPAWCELAAWPWGPVSDDGTLDNHSGADPYGPWHRDGVSYAEYRLDGPYADGLLIF